MAITIAQLRTFLAVASAGSVSGAAEALVVTQPSVSSAIGALNRELGCELLERAGRGTRLTAAGAAFLPYAQDVIGLLDQGCQAARQAAGGPARHLRIAAVTTAAESFVPPLMREFAGVHPHVHLTLDVGNRDYVFSRVLAHEADVAISGRPPADDRLAYRTLAENRIGCITAPGDRLAQEGAVEAARLGDRPWLLREPGSGTRALVVDFLAERGLSPTTLTLGSNGAVKQAARAGLGVSLMSRVAFEDDLAAGHLAEIPLGDGPEARRWFVVWSAVGPVAATVSTFTEFLPAALHA